MFFSEEILTRKSKSGLAVIWIAATLGVGNKKLSKRDLDTVNLLSACDFLQRPPEPMALRLTSSLMVGVARVYQHQIQFLVNEVVQVAQRMRRDLLTGNGAVVHLGIGAMGGGVQGRDPGPGALGDYTVLGGTGADAINLPHAEARADAITLRQKLPDETLATNLAFRLHDVLSGKPGLLSGDIGLGLGQTWYQDSVESSLTFGLSTPSSRPGGSVMPLPSISSLSEEIERQVMKDPRSLAVLGGRTAGGVAGGSPSTHRDSLAHSMNLLGDSGQGADLPGFDFFDPLHSGSDGHGSIGLDFGGGTLGLDFPAGQPQTHDPGLDLGGVDMGLGVPDHELQTSGATSPSMAMAGMAGGARFPMRQGLPALAEYEPLTFGPGQPTTHDGDTHPQAGATRKRKNVALLIDEVAQLPREAFLMDVAANTLLGGSLADSEEEPGLVDVNDARAKRQRHQRIDAFARLLLQRPAVTSQHLIAAGYHPRQSTVTESGLPSPARTPEALRGQQPQGPDPYEAFDLGGGIGFDASSGVGDFSIEAPRNAVIGDQSDLGSRLSVPTQMPWSHHRMSVGAPTSGGRLSLDTLRGVGAQRDGRTSGAFELSAMGREGSSSASGRTPTSRTREGDSLGNLLLGDAGSASRRGRLSSFEGVSPLVARGPGSARLSLGFGSLDDNAEDAGTSIRDMRIPAVLAEELDALEMDEDSRDFFGYTHDIAAQTGSKAVFFDDLVPRGSSSAIKAQAFHHVLFLATHSLIRPHQEHAYADIELELLI